MSLTDRAKHYAKYGNGYNHTPSVAKKHTVSPGASSVLRRAVATRSHAPGNVAAKTPNYDYSAASHMRHIISKSTAGSNGCATYKDGIDKGEAQGCGCNTVCNVSVAQSAGSVIERAIAACGKQDRPAKNLPSC